jgi:microcystin degradation protein MlrC
MRVFVAGFHHETNTFAPSPADWAAFSAGAGYPPYARGRAMLEQMTPAAMAIGGFAMAARERGWRLVPSVWAGAMPSNRVTADAFERIAGEIVDDLRTALADGPLDAIYLDLHGAAVAEGVDDAEGELLERLRRVVQPSLPIAVSLDLHANVTARMRRLVSTLTAYRSYPHVDMRETGARAAERLARRLPRPGMAVATWFTHAMRVPFLLPLNAQCTLTEPARSVVSELERLESASGVELDFAMGFPAADFDECGPVVVGVGTDPGATRRAVARVFDDVVSRRREWAAELFEPAEAVERAIALASRDGPVVIADTQDNPGAGGDANTSGLLRALVEARAGRRLGGGVGLALMHDPTAAAAACAAGVGAVLELSLGRAVPTWTGELSDPPLPVTARVAAVSNGVVSLHGPMTAGTTARLGPSASLELQGAGEGIRVLVASGKAQMLDLDLCRFLGVEPAAMTLLVVKSSVHFRAAFAPVASHILVARAKGPMAADPGDLPWRHLPAGVATRP